MGLPASVSPIIYFKLSIKQFRYEDATAACAEGQAIMDSLRKEYEMLIGWSELYELAAIETNVADARTCCLNPASTTHRQMTDEQLKAAGVPAGLVRMSCGLESKEDLIADIAQALEKI